ncbi:MAG: hypothetical protein ACYYK0_07570 [Candidatus Eutrophobiaceae bacterium]
MTGGKRHALGRAVMLNHPLDWTIIIANAKRSSLCQTVHKGMSQNSLGGSLGRSPVLAH